LRSIQRHSADFQKANIQPVAISVDTPETSRNLCQKAGLNFEILSDPNVDAIRRYDLVHARAGEHGHDIARPAEFLVDPSGTVRWVNLTESFWVRATPEQVLEAAAKLQ
jgi:peroxiredoxin